MKILLVCQQSPHSYPLPAYGFWRNYFVAGLREAGHEVCEVPGADWARALLPLSRAELQRWRDEQWSRTLAFARATPGLDLFLSYLYPRQIEPAAVCELRSLGLPAVNFFCDNVREFRRLPAEFAPFNLHWVPEHGALPLYAARNWSALSAPMPCWVPPARRVAPEEADPGVVFIGRRDPLRGALLAHAAHAGLPLALYGTGWDSAMSPDTPARPRPTWNARLTDWMDFYHRQGLGPTWRRFAGRRRTPEDAFDFAPWTHPAPDDDGYARITATSAVTLGVNRCPRPEGSGPPLVYSRLRDIEAPMLGACYLTEWTEGLDALYDLDREIAVYRTAEELVEQARALLADQPRRLRLRAAGQRRALSEHTIGRSIGRLASALGLKKS